MNRTQFFEELNHHLKGLPEMEQRRLLDFYAEYFHDMVEAGMTEEEVSASLEPPAVIAQQLRDELNPGGSGRRESREQRGTARQSGADETGGESRPGRPASWGRAAGDLFYRPSPLIVVLLIFSIPFLIGLTGGLVALVFSLLAAVIGLFAGAAAALVYGAVSVFTHPFDGVLSIGVGLLLLGFSFFSLALSSALYRLLRKLFQKFPMAWRGFWRGFHERG